MSEVLTMKNEALEPLFAAWEEPNRHRSRATSGEGSEVRQGRRRSNIVIAQNLRAAVKEWRDNGYFGVSETTRGLLEHWFHRAHRVEAPGGQTFDFHYYFCQREAIETLIYLKECRRLERLSQVVAEFQGQYAETAALGITDEEDAWSRYAFKMATGSGKTKVMSLAIVWSYFHALRESESPMARHFVVIAPNLTVFERLKEDFKPEGGGPDIFDRDPLIPSEWRGDWNLSVVLQDEAGGAATGGTLYLTNIHRLFDTAKRKKERRRDVSVDGAAGIEGQGPGHRRGPAGPHHRPPPRDGHQRRGAPRLGPRFRLERGHRVSARDDCQARPTAGWSRNWTSAPRPRTTRHTLQAHHLRHAAGRGGGRRHRQDADHRPGRKTDRAGHGQCGLQVRGAPAARLRALAEEQAGVGEERQEALALRHVRGHQGGRRDRDPPERRRDFPATERPDDQPARVQGCFA